ncbi:MAG: hypothetical protein QW520_02090 [Methanomassiliicoccales archaeon]
MSYSASGKIGSMEWTQPKATARAYVLKKDGEEKARLTFTSPLGSLARGEYEGKVITLKRGGFLCPFISVRRQGETTNLAVLRFSWGFELSGQLSMADGRNYIFHGPSIRKDYFEITDHSGRPLCRLTHEASLLRRRGEFHDLGLTEKDPEPLFLAILLWYAAMMMFDEELAASSAAAPGECPTSGVESEREK